MIVPPPIEQRYADTVSYSGSWRVEQYWFPMARGGEGMRVEVSRIGEEPYQSESHIRLWPQIPASMDMEQWITQVIRTDAHEEV